MQNSTREPLYAVTGVVERRKQYVFILTFPACFLPLQFGTRCHLTGSPGTVLTADESQPADVLGMAGLDDLDLEWHDIMAGAQGWTRKQGQYRKSLDNIVNRFCAIKGKTYNQTNFSTG